MPPTPPKSPIPIIDDADLSLKLPRPPAWMFVGFIVLVILTWVPLALVARARTVKSDKPRIHLIQDMDKQPKVKAQASSELFADGRGMRPRITGTVARGQLEEDDHYYRGYRTVQGVDGQWRVEYFRGIPPQVRVDEALLRRGQARFNISCAPCHGLDGYGNGPVHQASVRLQQEWAITSIHAEQVREREDGHLYNTIRNGIRTMPAYGSQIDVRDRWAIVAYMRALQLSQNAARQQVPAEHLDRLK
jgi:mono/diheme cytochrome c family protein